LLSLPDQLINCSAKAGLIGIQTAASVQLQDDHGQIREAKCSLFKWFSGGKQAESQQTDAPDVVDKNDLPFPHSILDTTHLRGRNVCCGLAHNHIMPPRSMTNIQPEH